MPALAGLRSARLDSMGVKVSSGEMIMKIDFNILYPGALREGLKFGDPSPTSLRPAINQRF